MKKNKESLRKGQMNGVVTVLKVLFHNLNDYYIVPLWNNTKIIYTYKVFISGFFCFIKYIGYIIISQI